MDLSINEDQDIQIYLHRCVDVSSIKVLDIDLVERATAKREITIGNIRITMFEKDKEG
jgi:hypothetical protein